MNFIYNYGLFLIKMVTVVLFILLTCAIIITSIRKKQNKTSHLLKIKSLNKNYNLIKNDINESLMNKYEKKIWKTKSKQLQKKTFKNRNKIVDINNQLVFIKKKPTLYVLDFIGNISADGIKFLREEISSIISVAQNKDEVLLRLESSGGTIHEYGLAAEQLKRLRSKNIFLTISVDKIAASGGYMMACVANYIIAAPFSIIGSIGVTAQIPNIHKFLKKNDIDVELHTAGKYKRTLTIFGENTVEGREKFNSELNVAHNLFKEFVHTMRPILDIEKVSNGEYWFGSMAIKQGLIDSIDTSDDFIMSRIEKFDILKIEFLDKKMIINTIYSRIRRVFSNILHKILYV